MYKFRWTKITKKRRHTKKIKLYKCVQRIFERIKRQIISSQNIHVTELISRLSRIRAFILIFDRSRFLVYSDEVESRFSKLFCFINASDLSLE